MLPRRGEGVAEIDRDLRRGRTLRLKVAVPGDGAGGIVREDLVRRIQLVRDRILWPARPHE